MSDDLRKLQEAMTAVRGHLQDMQNEQKAMSRELKRLRTLEVRSVHLEASMAALGGTFAGVEQILVKVLADHERVAALATESATMKQTISDILRRVEALEKKAG